MESEVDFKISIVMPVFNAGRYLSQAIESILSQSYRNFDFIIINDGSTDDTLDILEAYGKKDYRIKIINQPHAGIVCALNKGIINARTDWIFRMDADDISYPKRVEEQIKMAMQDRTLTLIGSWCEQIDAQGRTIKINKYPARHSRLVRALENSRGFFPHPSVSYPKKKVIEAGLYRERFLYSEDTDLWLRLTGKGKFACYSGVLIKLRKHNRNISSVEFRSQQLKSIAARICHFRRKRGLYDPSESDEQTWVEFLRWIEKRLEQDGYFRIAEQWQALWKTFYPDDSLSKLGNIGLRRVKLIISQQFWKSYIRHRRFKNEARKLAKETENYFIS